MPHISIEARQAEHADALYAVLGDPRLYEFVDISHRPASASALKERLIRNAGNKSPDGTQDWLGWIIRDENGHIVGNLTATIMPSRETDLSYMVASQHWGKGIAKAALTQLLALLAKDYAVRCFCVVAERANQASVRLARQLGFVEIAADAASAARHQLLPNEVLLQKNI